MAKDKDVYTEPTISFGTDRVINQNLDFDDDPPPPIVRHYSLTKIGEQFLFCVEENNIPMFHSFTEDEFDALAALAVKMKDAIDLTNS